jgi:Leucine-rich repeat (LRR) protein
METSEALSTAVSSDPLHFLQLDPLCLKHVFHLVAMDHEHGIASTAALSQTCKDIYKQNDELLNCYKLQKRMELRGKWHEGAIIAESADHPFWLWLSKRQGRIPRLSVQIKPFSGVPHDSTDSCEEELEWSGPLKLLSTIPDLHLKVHMPRISSLEHPFARFWLQDDANGLIEELEAGFSIEDDGWLPTADFVQIAVGCKSLVLNRNSTPCPFWVEDLSNLTQLTSLSISNNYFLGANKGYGVWQLLANLTNLQHLGCASIGFDDPSPLSALTALTSLELDSRHLTGLHRIYELTGAKYFTFSSLQPLSTLQQLEVLELTGCSCSGTSLQGLGNLPRLRDVGLECRSLVSLQGLTPVGAESDGEGLTVTPALESLRIMGAQITSLRGLESFRGCLVYLCLVDCPKLDSLSGVEGINNLHGIRVGSCGLTSLEPLACLGRKQKDPEMIMIDIYRCTAVKEEILELPYLPATASVDISESNVKEVVVAGRLRRACSA